MSKFKVGDFISKDEHHAPCGIGYIRDSYISQGNLFFEVVWSGDRIIILSESFYWTNNRNTERYIKLSEIESGIVEYKCGKRWNNPISTNCYPHRMGQEDYIEYFFHTPIYGKEKIENKKVISKINEIDRFNLYIRYKLKLETFDGEICKIDVKKHNLKIEKIK